MADRAFADGEVRQASNAAAVFAAERGVASVSFHGPPRSV